MTQPNSQRPTKLLSLNNTSNLLNCDFNNVGHAPESAGFVALREEGHWRIYARPTEILVAHDPESLDRVLKRTASHADDGGEAAGFLAYEAGFALEPRLRPILAGHATTL